MAYALQHRGVSCHVAFFGSGAFACVSQHWLFLITAMDSYMGHKSILSLSSCMSARILYLQTIGLHTVASVWEY